MLLLDFIDAIEDELGTEAKCNYMEMQMGDVTATWANVNSLKRLTRVPETDVRNGIAQLLA